MVLRTVLVQRMMILHQICAEQMISNQLLGSQSP